MKEPDTEDYTLHDSIIWSMWKRQNYKDRKQIAGCWGLEVGVGIDCKQAWEMFGSDRRIPKRDGGDICITL